MNVRSESSVLTADQIREVLGLLHLDYQEMDYTIDVYSTVESCMEANQSFLGMMGREARLSYASDMGTYVAFADLENKRILLIEESLVARCDDVVFELERRKYGEEKYEAMHKMTGVTGTIRLHMIYTLLHELRHAWQSEYVTRFNAGFVETRDDAYMSLEHERDADTYARRMMNRHHDKLNEICGVDFEYEWIYGWYYALK